eukprot:339551-Prymnesium_polylepis.3
MRPSCSSDWDQRGRSVTPPAGPLPFAPCVVPTGKSDCGAAGCSWPRMSIQSSPNALCPHTESSARAALPRAPAQCPTAHRLSPLRCSVRPFPGGGLAAACAAPAAVACHAP